MSEGKKDEGKNRLDLVYPILIEQVGRVRTFAVTSKYGDPENWKTIDNLIPRYTAAAMRHFEAWRSGEKVDRESGLSHLAHCACNIMFLMEWERLHEGEGPGLAKNHADIDLHTDKTLGNKKEFRDEDVVAAIEYIASIFQDKSVVDAVNYIGSIASVFENDIELYLKICQILGEKW